MVRVAPDNEESIYDPWYPYTPTEVALLQRTFKILNADSCNLGCNIYAMIFRQVPNARKLFPYMTDAVVENREPEFRFQAMRFFQVIESGVKHLGHLDDFNQILDNLGRRHGKLKQSYGFQPYFWSVFLECSVYQIRLALERSKSLRWSKSEMDRVVILWRHLMQGICKRIEAGFLADASKRLQSRVENDVIPSTPTKSPNHETRVPLPLPVPDVSGSEGTADDCSNDSPAVLPLRHQKSFW